MTSRRKKKKNRQKSFYLKIKNKNLIELWEGREGKGRGKWRRYKKEKKNFLYRRTVDDNLDRSKNLLLLLLLLKRTKNLKKGRGENSKRRGKVGGLRGNRGEERGGESVGIFFFFILREKDK